MSPEEINEKILSLNQQDAQKEKVVNELVKYMIELNTEDFAREIDYQIATKGIEKTITQIIFSYMEKIGVLWITNHINPAGTLCNLRFRDEVEQTGENDDAERRVDEEGPAPREVRCQPAAENGTDGNHSADCGTPHGKRDSALFALEVRVDERERCGQHHCATDSLNHARKDKNLS
jgi:hypothetical protein